MRCEDGLAYLVFDKGNLLPDVALGQLELVLEIIESEDRVIILLDFGFLTASVDCQDIIV